MLRENGAESSFPDATSRPWLVVAGLCRPIPSTGVIGLAVAGGIAISAGRQQSSAAIRFNTASSGCLLYFA